MSSSLSLDKLNSILVSPCADTFNKYSPAEQKLIVATLRNEGLLARFTNALGPGIEAIGSDSVKRHLYSSQIQAERLHHFCQQECLNIHTALKTRGLTPTYLKGAAYTVNNSLSISGRMFTDIDVLVKQEQLKSAELALFSFGWLQKQMDNYDEEYYRNWAHEIPPLFHRVRDTIIDLHHNLVPPVSGRAPNIDLFLAQAQATDYGQVLRPAAMTLHSAIHLFMNEEFHNGYRDINDLHLLFSNHSSSEYWHDLLSLAKKTGFLHELYLAVTISAQFFETEVPDPFLSKLTQEAQRLTSKNKLTFLQCVYASALTPKHSAFKTAKVKLALSFCFVRGHMLKMPLKVLIPHMAHKLYRLSTEYLFGKGFGKKEMEKDVEQ